MMEISYLCRGTTGLMRHLPDFLLLLGAHDGEVDRLAADLHWHTAACGKLLQLAVVDWLLFVASHVVFEADVALASSSRDLLHHLS